MPDPLDSLAPLAPSLFRSSFDENFHRYQILEYSAFYSQIQRSNHFRSRRFHAELDSHRVLVDPTHSLLQPLVPSLG